MFIYPYRVGSKSVLSLKTHLGAKVLKLTNSKFTGGDSKIVINWGNSTPNPEVEKCAVMNDPRTVGVASNKKTFFKEAKDKCRIPPFTETPAEALEWIKDGRQVVVREKLTGHSGEGIVILNSVLEFEAYNHSKARLYVQYIPKKYEYRVHVVGEKIVFTQRKAKKTDIPNEFVNWQVRNHANGFVFVKNEDKPIPEDVTQQALLAIQAIGLDFGAVDVVWNEYKQEAYVLEINTAPGLEGTSGEAYANALRAYANMLGDVVDTNQPRMKKRKAPTCNWATIANELENAQAITQNT